MNEEEKELCPICKIREVEIDDMGYFGCNECYKKIPVDVRHRAEERALDQDLTGQDRERTQDE